MTSNSAPLPDRASAWEWAQVTLLAANLAWTTMCLGGFLAETMVVTSGLNGLLLAVHLLERASAKRPLPALHPAGWLLVPFLVYAAANVLWVTPVRWLGWRDWLGWAQMIAVFWVVANGMRSRAPRAALLWAMMAIGLVAVLLAAYQRFSHPAWLMLGRTQVETFIGRASGPFGIPNSLAALLLLLLPVAVGLALRRRAGAAARIWWGYLSVVFALGLVLTVSRGAWLALLVVLGAWPLFSARGSARRRTVLAAGIIAVVIATGAVLYFKVPLIHQRLVELKENAGELSRPIIWRGAWKIFRADPIRGGGGGSFDVRFDRYRPDNFQDDPLWAHNDYLNTLADYGAVGFALFFGAVGAIAVWSVRRARSAARRDWLDERPVRGAFAAGLAAFALQLFVDFHFKIPALAMAFATMAGLAVQGAWRLERLRTVAPAGRIVAGVGALIAVVAAVGLVAPVYRAEGLRYAARRAIDRMAVDHVALSKWPPILASARRDLERAVAVDPANGAAWADLAYAIAARAHLEPEHAAAIGRESVQAADRALEISPAVPEFWVRRGVALDLAGRWIEAGGAFVRALQLAPARGMVWYHHAYHLSLDKTDPGRALAAVRFCLRLDPGNREAQALRQRLAVAATH